MSRQYHLQRAPLSATLTREPVEWETVNRFRSEDRLRKTWWRLVNQPMHDTLYIYRMYNADTNEVIT